MEAYLSGQAVGAAEYDILFGRVNPSAKLPETFPVKLEDNPSYLFFPGEGNSVDYREGVFVGYRYYDKKKMEVLFPFGHGLSYTEFTYSNLRADRQKLKDTDTLTVSVDITNTGKRPGKEIVQLYVRDKESSVLRPEKELRDFAKIALLPGETKTVSFTLGKRAFAYYNTEIHDWYVESGEFDILIGKSSRDIVLCQTVMVESTTQIKRTYDGDSIYEDIYKDPAARAVVERFRKKQSTQMENQEKKEPEKSSAAKEAITEEMEMAMMKYMPLRGMLSFDKGSREELEAILKELNSL